VRAQQEEKNMKLWIQSSALTAAAGCAIALSFSAASADDCGPLFTDAVYADNIIQPAGIVFGDVDGDGILDMVSADAELGAGVHLGLGEGKFGPRVDYEMGIYIPDLGSGVSDITLGDLNGDGKLDLVTCGFQYDSDSCSSSSCCSSSSSCGGDDHPHGPLTYINNQVSYRLNNGDGTFGARTELPVLFDPQDVSLVDLDGDGDLDISCVQFDAFFGLVTWMNDGSASFGPMNQWQTSFGPTAVEGADVDGDGDNDILIARSFSHVLDVMLNDGAGTLAAPIAYPLSSARPGGMDVGDIDNDGDIDVAITVDSGSRLNVFTNDGSGVFTRANISTGSDPTCVRFADVDDDGDLDALVASAITRTINTHLNDGSGSFGPREFIPVAGVNKFDVADVNDDGLVDVGMSNYLFNGSFSVRLNTPNGLDALQDDYLPVSDPNKMSMFDFDSDGDLDIAVGRISSLSPNLAVMVNAGDGTYSTQIDLFTETNPYPATGDVNADGHPDIVTANLSGQSMSVFLNNGAGGFDAPVKLELGGLPRGSELADLDNDGDLDFVTNIGAADIIVLLFNDGAGAFGSRVDLAAPGNPGVPLVRDFDSDGNMDIIVSQFALDSVSIYMGNGDGTFDPPIVYGVDEEPGSVEVGDLDGDGDLDFITNNARSSSDYDVTISVRFNNGSGVFSGSQSIDAPGQSIYGLHIGDADDDGNMDILAGGTNFTVFRNNDGNATNWSSESFTDGRDVRSLQTVDINEDGATDLITLQRTGYVRVHYGSACDGAGCPADFTGDGALDIFDVFAYLDLFNASDLAADFTSDGVLDIFDVFAFLDSFNAGCP
jgi:hypothetical protein